MLRVSSAKDVPEYKYYVVFNVGTWSVQSGKWGYDFAHVCIIGCPFKREADRVKKLLYGYKVYTKKPHVGKFAAQKVYFIDSGYYRQWVRTK